MTCPFPINYCKIINSQNSPFLAHPTWGAFSTTLAHQLFYHVYNIFNCWWCSHTLTIKTSYANVWKIWRIRWISYVYVLNKLTARLSMQVYVLIWRDRQKILCMHNIFRRMTAYGIYVVGILCVHWHTFHTCYL